MIYHMFYVSLFLTEILRKLTVSKKLSYSQEQQFLPKLVIQTLLKPTSPRWKTMTEVDVAAILLHSLLKLIISSF